MISRLIQFAALALLASCAHAAGKTCADFCKRYVECVRLADSSADLRELERFVLECNEGCSRGRTTGRMPQVGLDCLAEMKCWKGMKPRDVENAVEACNPAKLAPQGTSNEGLPPPTVKEQAGSSTEPRARSSTTQPAAGTGTGALSESAARSTVPAETALGPRERTWRIDYRNSTGHWTGKIVVTRAGAGWTGKIWFDQYGRWEEIRNIRITASEMAFDRPGAGQAYTGRFVAGRRVVGTFTWSGKDWDWGGVETTEATAREPVVEARAMNLGPRANSSANDMFPQLSADGRVLYFTSNRQGGFGKEDFYHVERGPDGLGATVHLPAPLNSPRSDGAASFSGDGQRMVFVGCDRPEGLGGCDLYEATLEAERWSEPVNMGPTVNSAHLDSQPTLSTDGQTLIFSSNRPGGLGGDDLWITRRDASGSWSQPVNLGPPVNTQVREGSPYLAPDGKTLYFSSDRPGGFGGSDIYRSVLLQDGPDAQRTWRIEFSNVTGQWTGKIAVARAGAGWTGKIWFDQYSRWEEIRNIRITPSAMVFDRPGAGQTYTGQFVAGRRVVGTFTWSGKHWDWAGEETTAAAPDGALAGRWSDPVNMGRPINSEHGDISFTIGGAGDTGFLASNRPGGLGGLDLYSANVPPELRPEPTVIVRGVVTEGRNAAPVGADVTIEDISTGAPIARLRSNSATGRYLVVLPAGRAYGVSVSKEGHFFHSSRFDVPQGATFQEVTQDVSLMPLAVGARGNLNNVFFATGKTELSPESRQEIERAATLLHANPRVVVEIAGHTDSVGGFESNMKLSAGRAAVVRDTLVAAGIAADRLKAAGYGPTRPVAGNETEAGRQANRRTEMVVLSE